MSEPMRSLFENPQPRPDESSYATIVAEAQGCTKCRLCEGRSTVVFGEGPVPCPVLFIGEAPGQVEDQQGRPFVGPAGQLLTQILEAAGIPRDSVYITNTVKCRPPDNRLPQKDEMAACRPYLEAQIAHIKPSFIVTLGNAPTQLLLGPKTPGITKVRGQFQTWREGIEIFPMFHPSYLLRNQSKAPGSPKHLTWEDIQKVKARLDGQRGG